MNNRDHLKRTIADGIDEDRRRNAPRESKRALLVAFVGIPAVVLVIVAGWFALRIAQGG